MKTLQKTSKMRSLAISFAAAMLILVSTGCQEDQVIPVQDDPVIPLSGSINHESFRVEPSGTSVSIFNGAVYLDFPEGSVSSPTIFTIVTFPVPFMDGYNLMQTGYSLSGPAPAQPWYQKAEITLMYDPSGFNGTPPENEKDMAIFLAKDDVFLPEQIECIENCQVDRTSRTISGCIDQCGIYMVGEK